MNIVPDLVLVVLQALPFLVLIFGLNAIIFKPMIAYLAERGVATEGARKEAEALQERAELKAQQWDSALQRAHDEVVEFRGAKRAEAQGAYAKRMAVARKDADSRVSQALAGVAAEAEQARAQLAPMSRGLAAAMASRALGRELPGAGA
jgi:F-type H+-transporting ATPase subunit b